jgi:c-di-GMP-binding flagellar brake protein YcgR
VEMPQPNQYIELKLQRGQRIYSFPTYVEAVTIRAITVVHPRVNGQLIPLSSGDSIRVEYTAKGAGYMIFYTTILELGVSGSPVVQLAIPVVESVERMQRRAYVRLETEISLNYLVLRVPENLPLSPGPKTTYTRDISGNGAQILCKELYPVGSQLATHFTLGGQTFHTAAEVVRHIQQVSSTEIWTGIRFKGLSEKDRDMIIRYIFNQQLERRRMGLL